VRAVQIKEMINLAFQHSKLPSELILKKIGNTEFEEEINKRLVGKNWHDVNLEDWISIASLPTLMECMTPQGVHYFLPSLLLGVIDEPNYYSWGVDALRPHNKYQTEKSEWWTTYKQLFSEEQIIAVRNFLLYVIEKADDYDDSKYSAESAAPLW
jgi:hypothetical protein